MPNVNSAIIQKKTFLFVDFANPFVVNSVQPCILVTAT